MVTVNTAKIFKVFVAQWGVLVLSVMILFF